MANHKLWSREVDGQLPRWLTEEEKSRCYCDDRGWVLVHLDGNEEVIVASNTLNDATEKGHGVDEQGYSKDPDRNGNGVMTYSLGKSTSSVNEGSSVSIQLTTTYVADGTQVPYTITGIQSDDLSSGSLTGNFQVNGDSAFANISLREDSSTEGVETFVLTLGTGESISVNVNDTSISVPTYNLSSSSASVDEGENLTISLTTSNVADGPIAYTITGIQSDDLSSGSLTGNFQLSGGSADLNLSIASDLSFEEGNETLSLSLDNGHSVSVLVNDSSTATPTYTLSAPASINEGQELTITLNTQYVNDGQLGYQVTGIDENDLEVGSDQLTGTFYLDGGTADAYFQLSDDFSFEEGNETLTLSLDNGQASIDVNIVDSSTATPSYSLSTLGDVTFVNEGDSLTISLSTQYVSSGTAIPYTLGGSVDLANDFDSAISSTGQFVVGSSESITFNLKDDLSFEEGDETLTLSLDGLNTQISVVVKDTSKATEVYTLSAPASINEGQTLSITLNTQYVSAGTVVNYTLGGSVDLANDFDSAISSTGQFVIGTTETLNLTLNSDLSFNEGDETLTLTLQDGLGDVSVDVVDLSTATPSYILSAVGSINEGEDLTITLNTQYVNDGPVAYTISGIDDNDLDIAGGSAGRTGNINISTNTGSIVLKLKSDLSFNEGGETLTLTLDNGEDAINVTVNDSSTATPVYTLSAPASINEGQDLTITLNTQYVNDGTVGYTVTGIQNADLDTGSAGLSGNFSLSGGTDSIVLKLKEDLSENENNENLVLSLNNGEDSISVTIVDTSKAPVFNLSSNPLVSVDEGASLTINLSTENFSGNTVTYTVSGINDNDLDTGSSSRNGNFSLDGNGDGSLTFNIKEDVTTEGVDNFVLELVGHGQQIQVDINDTSLTPVYNLSTSPQFSVDEGLDLVITLQTQNVPDGDYAYNISGAGFDSDDLKPSSAGLTGNFTVSGSPSTDTITLQLKNDYSSNEGDETITIALNNGEDSIQVDVIDTSNMGSTDRGQLPVVNNDLKHPSISDDAQYAALGSTSSNGSVEIFKYNGTGWDLLQTLPKPTGAGNAHGMATAFNSDGTVFAVGDGWTNNYYGKVFIYRRGGNGQFSIEHTIDGPHDFTTFFGHGVALSDNSLFVACTQTNKIHKYDYDSANQQWPSSASYTLDTPVKYRDVDVSSDGLMLVASGGYSSPFEARVWTWDGSSYVDHSVISMPTQNATLGVAISNKKLLAVGQVGTINQENRVTLFDLDGTTWTPRPLEAWQTSATVGSWTINKGFKIALSEPKNDGKVLLVDHEGQMRDIIATTDTYSISGPSSINEGQDLSLTLTALGIDGQVGYSISGISDADLDLAGGSAPRTGNFDVSDSTGTIILKLKEDANSTDGSLTITLNNGEASKTVSIIDITPSYELTSSPQISVDEGVTLRISLSTQNVSETSIPYSVSGGIDSNDLDTNSAALTGGSFNLDSNGDGFVEFHIKEDSVTEGTENLVLTLTGLGEQISVNVLDTSREPIWSLTTDPAVSVDEGNDLLITLATQNIPAGNYAYQIQGSSGFGAEDLDIAGGSAGLTGNFTITGATNDTSSHSIALKLRADYATEGEETLTISLDNNAVSPITITVNDTSNLAPDVGPSIPAGDSRYPSISDDGMYAATVGGNHAANIAKFYKYENSSWTHTQSISNDDPGASNIDGYGDCKLSSDGSIFTYCDPYANNSFGIVRVFVRGGDGQYTLRDTFTPGDQNFQSQWGMALSGDGNTIVIGSMTRSKIRTFEYSNSDWNEVSTINAPVRMMGMDMTSDGQKLVFSSGFDATSTPGFYIYNRNGNSWSQDTFQSIDYPNGGSVRLWSVAFSRNGNFVAAGTGGTQSASRPSRIFFCDYDSGSNSWNQRAGAITDEGTGGSFLYFNEGRNIALSEESNGQITLITTDGQTYTLPATLNTYTISGPDSIDEDQDLTLTLNTLGINGDIAYTISGITDADLDIAGGSASTSGNFSVANETGSITLKLKEDADFDDGSLTITVDQGGEDEVSKTVTINDITSSYILTATNTLNGAINEGEDLIINLSTTNVSGPVPYEVTGNYESNDFDTGGDPLTGGSFTLDQNGQSSVTFKIKADETTDGPESLTLTLTGTGADPISITINDTSIEPTSEVGVISNYGGVPAISGDSTVMATYVVDIATSTHPNLTVKGNVSFFNRNPSTNEIETTPFTTIQPPSGGGQNTDSTEFGRQNVSLNNDGTIVAIGATGDGDGKVYLYKQNDSNQYDPWKTISAPESNKFGFCSLSGDGNTLVVGSSENNKVYTYEYDSGGESWNPVATAEFTLPVDLSSVSISNTKNSLIVGSHTTNRVYTYDWNDSNSSWDLRNGGLLQLQPDYGNYQWGNTLSLTNDGNTMVLSSKSSTSTWHVWDWDSDNQQWVNRLVGYEDNSGSYNPLGNTVASSAVNNGVITLAITWKWNSNAEVRLINIPKDPS